MKIPVVFDGGPLDRCHREFSGRPNDDLLATEDLMPEYYEEAGGYYVKRDYVSKPGAERRMLYECIGEEEEDDD